MLKSSMNTSPLSLHPSFPLSSISFTPLFRNLPYLPLYIYLAMIFSIFVPDDDSMSRNLGSTIKTFCGVYKFNFYLFLMELYHEVTAEAVDSNVVCIVSIQVLAMPI